MAMRHRVADDLTASADDFNRVVWPAIQQICGGGTYESFEYLGDVDLKKKFDLLAGIDGIQIMPDGMCMRGIASRVQWGHDYGTFTIRETRGSGAVTELAKRLHAIEHPEKGYILPHLTVHAYVSRRKVGQLLSVAVAKTRELIPYAAAHLPGVRRRCVKQDNGGYNWFLTVDWGIYKKAGYTIWIHRALEEPVIHPSCLPDVAPYDDEIDFSQERVNYYDPGMAAADEIYQQRELEGFYHEEGA